MKIVNSNEFNNEINNGYVLVDFFAEWCGPCKMLAPVLEEISNERNDVKIIKVNVDESEDIAAQFGIMSIPTLILFKDGSPVSKTGGYQQKEALNSFLNQVIK